MKPTTRLERFCLLSGQRLEILSRAPDAGNCTHNDSDHPQQVEDENLDATGLDVWNKASIVLCDYLHFLFSSPTSLLSPSFSSSPSSSSKFPRSVLELGCGMGLVGLACANLKDVHKVVMTDFHPWVLQLCQRNIDNNDLGAKCEVKHLDLMADPHLDHDFSQKIELLLGSEVAYTSALATRLFGHVCAMLAQTTGIFLLVHTVRCAVMMNEQDEIVKEEKDSALESLLELCCDISTLPSALLGCGEGLTTEPNRTEKRTREASVKRARVDAKYVEGKELDVTEKCNPKQGMAHEREILYYLLLEEHDESMLRDPRVPSSDSSRACLSSAGSAPSADEHSSRLASSEPIRLYAFAFSPSVLASLPRSDKAPK